MEIIDGIKPYFVPILFSVIYFFVYFIFILFIKLIDKQRKEERKIQLLPMLKKPLFFWVILASVITFLPVINLKTSVINLVDKIILILFILSVTLLSDKTINGFISESFKKITNTDGSVSLFFTISKLIIYTIGSLLVFHVLGISIAPILTALGVGGLAVSLALQDTLSNLFSGIHILFSKQIRVGDYIKLDSGEEGYVVDINWRDLTIRQIQNNIVIVPNKNMVSAKVINFYLPRTETTVIIPVGVSYDSDLEKVEEITIQVAKEVMEQVNGGVPDFDPLIRFNNFGDSSIDFSVILRVKEYTNKYLIKHEFIKKLHKRYKIDHIDIPYPISSIYLKNSIVKEEKRNNEESS